MLRFCRKSVATHCTRPELAKETLVAHENLKGADPASWRGLQGLMKACNDWTDEMSFGWCHEASTLLDLILTAMKWHKAFSEDRRLRLKLIAAGLLTSDSEPNQCPLCEQDLPKDHYLRRELVQLRQAGDTAGKTLDEALAGIRDRLSRAVPSSVQGILAASLRELVLTCFEQEIGRQLRGRLATLKERALADLHQLQFPEPRRIPMSILPDIRVDLDSESLAKVEVVCDSLDQARRQIALVEATKHSALDLTEATRAALGYSQVVSANKDTLLSTLSRAYEIASAAKPLQDCAAKVRVSAEFAAKLFLLARDRQTAERVRDAAARLAPLKDLADAALEQDLSLAEAEMKEYYHRLYDGTDFALGKVESDRDGKRVKLQFLVEYQGTLVDAQAILNSSRIQALLWSYVLALTTVAPSKTEGDWLDFSIVDEPVVTLDEEHRSTIAEMLFGLEVSRQYIVTSHDLYWPREMKRMSGLAEDLQYRDCFGLSPARQVVRVGNWIDGVQRRWSQWNEDHGDIDKGRDYVASVRVWIEEELKDLLRWADKPSLASDTLGKLIDKLHAASSTLYYQCDEVTSLVKSLRSIKSSLNQSHHEDRKALFSNGINKVHAEMDNRIVELIAKSREIVGARFSGHH